jgi:hypothetical protein
MSKVDLDPGKMLGFKILGKDAQPAGPSQKMDARLKPKIGGKATVGACSTQLGSKVGTKLGSKVGLKPV